MATKVQRAAVRYPGHYFKPEDLLHFVELRIFTHAWDKDLGLNDENDLCALQLLIMFNPKGGDPISGTGGVRKLRFSPDAWQKGKSGAVRVLYAYFEEFKVVLLIYAYAKNDREDINEDDKKAIRKSVDEVRDFLQRGGQLS